MPDAKTTDEELADKSGLDSNPRLNPTAVREKRKRFTPHYSWHDRSDCAMSCETVPTDLHVAVMGTAIQERLVSRHWIILLHPKLPLREASYLHTQRRILQAGLGK